MILKRIMIGLSLLAFFLTMGCTTKDTGSHKTWMNLAKTSETIQKAKERAIVDLPEDDGSSMPQALEGPRVKDLSSKKDTDNPYLKKVSQKKPYDKAASIDGEGVMLNFDNADIYEVIQVIAEVLNLSYIIDPQVKGVVNIRSGAKIPTDQLYTIFKKLLNINGIDIRPEADHYYIQMSAKASSQLFYGKDQIGNLKNSSKMVTQVVPVLHISSTAAQKLIEPYLSTQANILNLDDQNTLIVSDFESKIIDGLVILERVDVSSLSALNVKMIKIEQAPLFDVKTELEEVLSALKVNKKDYQGIQIMALERVNSLLLVGYDESLINTAEKWITELDRAPTEGRDSVYIYNVRNSVASELSDLVSSLISDKASSTTTKKTSSRSSSTSKTSATPPGTAKPSTRPQQSIKLPTSNSTTAGSMASMQFAGEPVLIADDARNIILIRALLTDYTRVLKLLERLDNMPMQVLVEVLVAEVSLTDEWQYGVEWFIRNNNTGVESGEIGFKKTGLNFNLTFDSQKNVFDLFDVLATNNDFSILSSPQVLVLNNETATVNVGEQVPIVTSQTSDTVGSATTTSNQTVQYKDTGVILNVTPRINYDGIIIIEIDQQVSSVKDQTTGGIDSPTISTKSVKTKLAIKDGQSILMGGLISKEETKNNSGVPFLKDIPFLGWAFKNQSDSAVKKELVIMVTPYVIESEDILDQYINSFREKMSGLRHDLEK